MRIDRMHTLKSNNAVRFVLHFVHISIIDVNSFPMILMHRVAQVQNVYRWLNFPFDHDLLS